MYEVVVEHRRLEGSGPIVIAHRGASGYRPEHTLAAYALAIEQGADFIEPDLVATKDGVLVARHENEIGTTTDVADHPEFLARRARKVIDGVPVSGFFTEDFTLAELKTLRARERLPLLRPDNTRYDGAYAIPTLEEVLALAAEATERLGRQIGVYPETKHPSYFAALGLPLEERLVSALHAHGHRGRDAPVFIQSFEVENLRALRRQTELRLIQLIAADGAPYDLARSGDPRTYATLLRPAGLSELAETVAGIGVQKELIIPRDGEARLGAPTALCEHARRAGLAVHAWTFRRENAFLPRSLQRGADTGTIVPHAYGDLAGELALFYAQGIDGVFCDQPDVAVSTRAALTC